MNGLSVRELCCLFCCPPWPSRIAAKLAFLPPEPTYTFVEENGAKQTICLSDRAEWQYSEREKDNLEVFYTRTSRHNRIACMFIRYVEINCSKFTTFHIFCTLQVYSQCPIHNPVFTWKCCRFGANEQLLLGLGNQNQLQHLFLRLLRLRNEHW
jgi:hypothetical protein